MAKQGTQRVLAGTPYKRYPDPNVKGSPDPRGLYPWSAFRASLGFLNKGTGDVVYEGAGSLDGPPNVELLLFTTDIPAIATAISYDGNNALAYPYPSINLTFSLVILSSTSGGATGVVGGKYGEVLAGYAGVSQSVYCTGFPALANFVQVNGNDATVYAFECLANGAVISSPVGSNNPYSGNTIAPVPLLLLATDYTQAMYDAGNLYKSPTSNFLYQIVGLYKTLPI